MPHVSRIKLSKKTEEELIKSLNVVLTHIDKDTDMLAFLTSLLTPTEKLMLAKRLAIIVLIEEGQVDSQIANALNLTRMTVSKMRLFYEARGMGFRIGLKKLKNQKRLSEFKELLNSLSYTTTYRELKRRM